MIKFLSGIYFATWTVLAIKDVGTVSEAHTFGWDLVPLVWAATLVPFFLGFVWGRFEE